MEKLYLRHQASRKKTIETTASGVDQNSVTTTCGVGQHNAEENAHKCKYANKKLCFMVFQI